VRIALKIIPVGDGLAKVGKSTEGVTSLFVSSAI
jgi:hypothetical protein